VERGPAQLTGGRARALAGLCATLLPAEEGGPDSAALSAALSEFLSRQPALVARAVTGGALGLELCSLAGSGRSLCHRPAAERAALWRWLHRGPLGLGLDGLKALVVLVHGAGAAAGLTAAAATDGEAARPDAVLDVTPASDWPAWSRADAVVVGSGAGGALAARTLAGAGMSVVVLEEGRRHGVEEFRTTAPLERFAGLYRDGGATAALGRPPVMVPIGRGVGGTTLVNSGTCYRTPAAVLERWRHGAGLAWADPEAFAPALDEVWALLQVGAVPASVMGRNGALALAGARALGWRSGPLMRNAPGCGGCCQCAIGCPRNAKFGVHLNALPQACRAGARIVAEARVVRLVVERGRATGVLARRPDGTLFTVRAGAAVVVSAGATETPPLLRRSGLGRHPHLGRNLAVHPAVGVSGQFDAPVVAWQGVLQSAAVEEFHETDGILVEATATPPGMGSMELPGVGRELLDALDDAGHQATLGAMVADRPVGRVMGRGRPLLYYDLHPADGRRLVRAVGIMGRVLFAAGATEVLTGVPARPRVHSPAELDEAVAVAEPRHMHVAAFHPCGTAAAGADPSRFPLTPRGALRGVGGLWVLDASTLPGCAEVNPQVTIMAVALTLSRALAVELGALPAAADPLPGGGGRRARTEARAS
jgi:choline dehydrogenase-like flavoprotein